MNKIIQIFLILLSISSYSQVVMGDQTTVIDTSLSNEDLDVQGNLKVEAIEELCKKGEGDEVTCPPYNQVYLSTKTNGKKPFLLKGNIPKIFQRVVFYIKVGNEDDKIVRFDTKINSKKYMAILGSNNLYNSSGKSIKLNKVGGNLEATKDLTLFEYEDPNNPGSTTWAISADYTSKETGQTIWRIELLLMNRAYVTSLSSANPLNIYDTEVTNVERKTTKGGVGIGEKDPKANLDVKGKLSIKDVTDVSAIVPIKNRTLPLVIDVSKVGNEKSDSWGILKAAANQKAAYPVNLKIDMNGGLRDFLSYLRLGLDPQKYTPMLANTQLSCKTNADWGISFISSKQPTPNNFLTEWDKDGVKDWALYLDFVDGDPKGCGDGNVFWDVTLLVFRNQEIIDIPVYVSDQVNSAANPIVISDYDASNKGYTGAINESPLP